MSSDERSALDAALIENINTINATVTGMLTANGILIGQVSALQAFCLALAQSLPRDLQVKACLSLACSTYRPDETKDQVAATSFDQVAQMFGLALDAPQGPLPPIEPTSQRKS